MACFLRDRGYLPNAGEPNEALGIISPYAAQTALLQGMLNEKLGVGQGPRYALTVHRFQGNEKDAIIIDLADSPVLRLSRFVKARDIDDDGARLLNVAFSRARNHVVLVANLDYLRANLPESSVTTKILDHFLQGAIPIPLDDVFHLAPEEWLDSLRPMTPPSIEFDPNTAGIFSEGTFYPAFGADVNHAQESIVIFSPFATRAGVSRWMDLFAVKVAAGVQVRIVTKPNDEPALIDEMGLQGIVVDLRDRMHEKIALIDGCTLWEGSLNILSHRDTSEIMIRVPSAAACNQVARFISTPMGKRTGEGAKSTIAEKENPECPGCGHATLWKNGRFGPYFVCQNCGGKIDARTPGRLNKAKSSRRPRQPFLLASNDKVCPQCGSPMIVRSGKRGDFWGCSKYPQCRHTASI
jgi:predicted RNA-binding Zn-ribbon protein involved in translation (DUF1610 family)